MIWSSWETRFENGDDFQHRTEGKQLEMHAHVKGK